MVRISILVLIVQGFLIQENGCWG